MRFITWVCCCFAITKRKLPFVTLLLFLSFTALVPALGEDSISDITDQLKTLNQRIQQLNQHKSKNEGELGKLQLQLRDLDKKIGDASKDLRDIEEEIKTVHHDLSQINQQIAATQARLNKHSQLLARHIRAFYQQGNAVQLRSLLTPNTLAQHLHNKTYFEYLQRYRTKLMSNLTKVNESLKTLEAEKTSQLTHLATLKKAVTNKKQAIEGDIAQRKGTIDKLRKNLKSSHSELKSLQSNRGELNHLLQQLRTALEKQKEAAKKQKKRAVTQVQEAPFDAQTPFRKLKGKLRWPINGDIESGKTRNGVNIYAKEGTQVEAISHGRVVFADWMRGLGLLTIIDHGDGYMSLYGHNQSLYKKPGDWVDAGSVIAVTGKSGGTLKPGVYFEIRKNTKTLNPLKWCKSS